MSSIKVHFFIMASGTVCVIILEDKNQKKNMKIILLEVQKNSENCF